MKIIKNISFDEKTIEKVEKLMKKTKKDFQKTIDFILNDYFSMKIENELNQIKRKNYKHIEAFCLMEYTCKKCNTKEIIWNSRDGVTPFIITCSKCKGEMQHTNWQLDHRVENHKLKSGDRFFRNTTKKDYLKYLTLQQNIAYKSNASLEEKLQIANLIDDVETGKYNNYQIEPMIDTYLY